MMARAESATNQPYELYGGPRIANFSQDQQNSFDLTRAGAVAGLGSGLAGQGYAIDAAQGLSTPGYQAGQIRGQNFGQRQADQYMSPYINNVLDAQRGRALRRFDEQTLQRDGAAARAGVFGGYRHGVQQAMAERDLNEQLNFSEATALQSGFENAQQQFERDRAAGLSRFQANEGARQRGEELRLGRLRELSGSGETLAGLGGRYQDQILRGAGALQGIGAQQQQREQASLDLAQQDFASQRDYDRNMINFLSGILRGVPVSPTATTSQYTNPNPYSQALGLGVSGLALQNMFGGGRG